MKHCSFEVAKAIKEAGYPQDENKLLHRYVIGPGIKHERTVLCDGIKDEDRHIDYILAPEYLKIWLWLWREKGEYIEAEHEGYPHTGICLTNYVDAPFDDPEEAIIAAIEYLVTNDLVK